MPEVDGSWNTPNSLPKNTPMVIPRWVVPGATEMPDVPAEKLENSGKFNELTRRSPRARSAVGKRRLCQIRDVQL